MFQFMTTIKHDSYLPSVNVSKAVKGNIEAFMHRCCVARARNIRIWGLWKGACCLLGLCTT